MKTRGKGCTCIYDFIHSFFVADMKNAKIFIAEDSTLKTIGYNDSLPCIECQKEKVYVARWWFSQNIDKLIDSLSGLCHDKLGLSSDEMRKYVSTEGVPEKPLEFTLKECTKF